MIDADSIWFRLFKSVWACFVSAVTGSVLWGFTSAFQIALHDRQHFPKDQHMPGFFEALKEPWLWSQALSLAIVAFVLMLIFAMPLQAFLQKLRLTGYGPTIFMAIAIGGVLAIWLGHVLETIEFDAEDWEYYQWHFDPKLFGTGIFFAIFYGSVAWLIRRPDRDAPKALP